MTYGPLADRRQTFVMNHDTQPSQALEAIVLSWFKPLAYALILLREAGYPSVFWGDLYGICDGIPESMSSTGKLPPACSGKLPDLVLVRHLFAYGPQVDYFDAPNCIGWTRLGTHDRGTSGLAVVLSNAGPSRKKMFVGKGKEGERWVDVMGYVKAETVIDKRGVGAFWVPGKGLSVWIEKSVWEREKGRFGCL